MLPIPRAGVLRDGRRPRTPRARSPGSPGSRSRCPVVAAVGAAPRRRPLPRLPVRPRRTRPAAVEAALRAAHDASAIDIDHLAWTGAHPPGRDLRARPAAAAVSGPRRRTCEPAGHDVRAVDVSVDDVGRRARRRGPTRSRSRCPMHTATRLARELAPTSRPHGVDRPRARASGSTPTSAPTSPTRRSSGTPRLPALPPATCCRRSTATPGSMSAASSASSDRSMASRGCAHRCRHCPVPVVFDGRVQRLDEDAVLADIAQLVAAGAQHITFGDPDFLNAPPHSRRVVRAMHERFPDVTFDCTVKVEHVLAVTHDVWPELADAGCLFVVSAFESVDDAVLEPGSTRGTPRPTPASAVGAAARRTASTSGRRCCRSRRGPPATSVRASLDFVARRTTSSAASTRCSTRSGCCSRRARCSSTIPTSPRTSAPGTRNGRRSRGRSADPAVDELQQRVAALVEADGDAPSTSTRAVRAAVGAPPVDLTNATVGRPRLTESWFCCAEPTELQLQRSGATEVSFQSRC